MGDALLVKDGDHPARERVVRDLRDEQELVLVDRARTVPVELHEPLLEPLDLRRRDCQWSYHSQFGELEVGDGRVAMDRASGTSCIVMSSGQELMIEAGARSAIDSHDGALLSV